MVTATWESYVANCSIRTFAYWIPNYRNDFKQANQRVILMGVSLSKNHDKAINYAYQNIGVLKSDTVRRTSLSFTGAKIMDDEFQECDFSACDLSLFVFCI